MLKGQVAHNRVDYSGKVFNYLTAVRFVKKNVFNRCSVWEFRCVCGKLLEVQATMVKRGHTKSCGCKKSELITRHQLLPNGQATLNEAFASHRFSAGRRGIETHLTKDEYLTIVKQPCRYCGGFSSRKNTHTGQQVVCNSVDRLNNEPYYKLSNSVPSCFVCQTIKMDMTEEEFLTKVRQIAAFREMK